jgi:hypothetical protein
MAVFLGFLLVGRFSNNLTYERLQNMTEQRRQNHVGSRPRQYVSELMK